ncbi:MAG: sigma-54 dependent transcriptional regulator [Sandaracinaceae bacterium]|nr:sigma-54 dependent transcriptional regulator [Sandaracinaceae bacterium]
MQVERAASPPPWRRARSPVARSCAMQAVLRDLGPIAESDAPVLVLGESGTGKELIARELHQRSARAGGRLASVNCAAFVDTLIDDQLFGHERGAFTGAVARTMGRFEAADGGTLFLDEVGELPMRVQAKLLRVLQEGTFERLGSNETLSVDVRVVSATHRDLRTLVAEGRFREDLYYRLRVLEIRLPPLRERGDDLPELVSELLEDIAPGRQVAFSPEAWRALAAHPFPGNVRELRAALQHATVLSRGRQVELWHLPPEIAASAEEPASVAPLADVMRTCERRHLLEALRAAGGHRTRAAEMLGISRKNLWEKLRAHGIGGEDIARARSGRDFDRA